MKEIRQTEIKQTEAHTSPPMRVVHGENSTLDNSTGRCLAFAEAARQLRAAAGDQSLVAPSFRSPPREVGRRRSLARHQDGSVTVAVMIRSRVWEAVLADMVEGVIAANRLEGVDAEALRDQLWEALKGEYARREAA